MKFDTPATNNPIDQLKIVGKPTDRIDGPYKTTGTAPYAYERHDVVPNQAYGFILGSAIAKGRIRSMDVAKAKAAPGVITIVNWQNAGKLGKAKTNTAKLLGGTEANFWRLCFAASLLAIYAHALGGGIDGRAFRHLPTSLQQVSAAFSNSVDRGFITYREAAIRPPDHDVFDRLKPKWLLQTFRHTPEEGWERLPEEVAAGVTFDEGGTGLQPHVPG